VYFLWGPLLVKRDFPLFPRCVTQICSFPPPLRTRSKTFDRCKRSPALPPSPTAFRSQCSKFLPLLFCSQGSGALCPSQWEIPFLFFPYMWPQHLCSHFSSLVGIFTPFFFFPCFLSDRKRDRFRSFYSHAWMWKI